MQRMNGWLKPHQWLCILYGPYRNKSANFWAHSTISNPQIRESNPQIRKFVMINPQNVNPQISLVSQSANRKSANLQGKKQCFLSRSADPHWFASNFFSSVTLSQNCPKSQKSSLNLKESILSLFLYGEKLFICRFADFKWDNWVRKSVNRKSAKCHTCGRSANLRKKFVRKFADWHFAVHICAPPNFVFKFLYSDVGLG